jgi:putative restriction endonuclease
MEAGKLLIYKYRGDDPYHTDNVGLRNTIKNRTPLIYFISFRKGYYYAHWPVFIVNDNIPELNFYVDLTGTFITHNKEINDFESAVESSAPEKLYSTSQIKVRLYQKIFRENILMAYKCRCSLCKLRHRELLDAAHIIADKEEKGIPVIQNGISLCKIHHAAFDNNILGITPDYSIAVRKDVLKESDGPMLKFGIQELNDKKIILPANKEYWPDKDRLNDRFERFLKAG